MKQRIFRVVSICLCAVLSFTLLLTSCNNEKQGRTDYTLKDTKYVFAKITDTATTSMYDTDNEELIKRIVTLINDNITTNTVQEKDAGKITYVLNIRGENEPIMEYSLFENDVVAVEHKYFKLKNSIMEDMKKLFEEVKNGPRANQDAF